MAPKEILAPVCLSVLTLFCACWQTGRSGQNSLESKPAEMVHVASGDASCCFLLEDVIFPGVYYQPTPLFLGIPQTEVHPLSAFKEEEKKTRVIPLGIPSVVIEQGHRLESLQLPSRLLLSSPNR